jgi:hypothetical protein
MSTLSKKAFSIILIAIGFMAGCESASDPEPRICNCDSKVSSNFNSVQGIMTNTMDGIVFLSPVEGYYEICNDVNAELSVDGLMVTASGDLKSTCIQEHDVVFKMIDYSFVNINSWNIVEDSLFTEFPAKIKIIKSEYPGYEPGFGYDVQTSDGGVHIVQTHLPAVGGKKPFKTATDAFKTAVLVAYKLNSDMGLPTITVADLQYLKVLY